MIFARKGFGILFMALLVFGLYGIFGRGGNNYYHDAYQQGYFDGQQAARSEGAESAESGAQPAPKSVPDGRRGTQVYYRGHGFFFPALGFLWCLIPLFFFGLLFMGMGKHRWHRGHRGHWGHGNWENGPCGPRGKGPRRYREPEPKEKSPEDIDDGPGPDEPIYRA